MKTTSKGYLFQRDKDSTGKPCGIFYLMYSIHGSRKLVSLKTKNKTEAEKRRNEILTPALMANTAEKVTRHIAETRELLSDVKYPLEIVWRQYLKSSSRPQSSMGTLGNYERCWKLFVVWLRENHPDIERVNQITQKEAELYAAHLWKNKDKEITANTFNYHIQGLNLIFKIVCDTTKTPFSDIQRKKGGQISRKDFTADQMKSIFGAIDNPECKISNRPEMKLLCYIGACTGLRLADAILLKYSQIDFASRMITATPMKTRGIQRKIHIPLHPELKSQLDRAESLKNGNEYVLPAMIEIYKRNPDGIMKDFMEVLDTAKLTEIIEAERGKNRRAYGFHSFRHSFASFAANAGVPISTLAAILGDNTRTLEKYYVKISDESKKKAIMSMPLLNSGTDTGIVIDLKPVSEADELRIRINKAIDMLRKAKISNTARKELQAILEDGFTTIKKSRLHRQAQKMKL